MAPLGVVLHTVAMARTFRISPFILSGGAGSRLWPLSRASLPKQLLALHGNRTMIQDTVLRAAALPGAAAPVLLCNQDHRFLVAEQMLEAGLAPGAILLEPQGRNTAPATAIASLVMAERDPSAVILLLPSDHVVLDDASFHASVERAAAAATQGHIVTFGVKPQEPETGYGYVQRGARVGEGVFAVQRFAEKPDAERALSYLASGDYYWNSGMFMFRADVMLAELKRFQPAIVTACRAALVNAKRDLDFVRLDPESFAKAPEISIDYAVMERTDKAAVVPCDIGWSDVGAWSTLWELGSRDKQGNVLRGDVLVHETTNSFVRSDSKLTALVGVENLVVIVTSDAVLVVDKDAAQDVKAVVDQLKAAKRQELTEHRKVFRPWGSYESIDAGDGFQVKHMMVKPGGRLSLQTHSKRAEHWVVVQGVAKVTCGERVFELHENESTFIPLGAKHRLENSGGGPLRLIEVQSGSYLGEDDIVRHDDVYGRVPSKSVVKS